MSAEPEDKFDWAKYLMEGEDADMGPYPDTPVSHRAHLYECRAVSDSLIENPVSAGFCSGWSGATVVWCNMNTTPQSHDFNIITNLCSQAEKQNSFLTHKYKHRKAPTKSDAKKT